MKKTIVSLCLAIITVSVAITGCKKETNPNTDAEGFKATLKQLVNTYQPKKYELTLSADNGALVVGVNTRVKFLPGAFTYSNGNIVTGNVQLEFQEFYKKSQMVLANKPTVAWDGLLQSGGEVFIRATKNGEQLSLAPNKATIYFKGRIMDTTMSFFTGYAVPDSFSGVTTPADETSRVIWSLDNSAPAVTAVPTPTSDSAVTTIIVDNTTVPTQPPVDTSYVFPFNTTGWGNCDGYVPNYNATNLAITLATGFNGQNVMVALVYKNSNTIDALFKYGNDFLTWRAVLDEPVIVAVIGYQNGVCYTGYKEFTITTNRVEAVALTPGNSQQFYQTITSLMD